MGERLKRRFSASDDQSMRTSPGGRHPGDDEHGFTLVELMVVVLIIAILIAIAIPTYLGVRQQATDRATQSNVRNAFTATRILYNAEQTYAADLEDYQALEGSLLWQDEPLGPGAAQNAIYLSIHDSGQTVIVGGRTNTGRCFFLKDVMGADAGTYYDSGTGSDGSCPTPDPDVIVNPNWSSTAG